MSNRRALRTIIAAALAVPPSIVYEAARAIVAYCPLDPVGPHGRKAPSAATVAWHLLAVFASLPVLHTFNRWPDGRAAGIADRARRLSELQPMGGNVVIHGSPPPDALAIAAAGLPFLQAVEQLLIRLLKPALFLDMVEGTAPADRAAGPLRNKPGVVLTIHGGVHHMHATIRFRFRDGATLQTIYRHPDDEHFSEPPLVVRVSIGLEPLDRLAGVVLGVDGLDDFSMSPPPVAAPPPAPARRRPAFSIELIERQDAERAAEANARAIRRGTS